MKEVSGEVGGNQEIPCPTRPPDAEWILKNILESELLFQIGWYKHAHAVYRRLGGHYVSSAGYEEKSSLDQEAELIIHDPSKRSECIPVACDAIEIERGILAGNQRSIRADGYLQMIGIKINATKGADTAINDGAFAFKVVRRS